MAVSFTSVKCPECGAAFQIEEGRDMCFCTYCGNKIYIDDADYTYKYVDAAKMKELEYKEKMDLIEMERDQERYKRISKAGLVLGIVFTVIAIILTVVCVIGIKTTNTGMIVCGIFAMCSFGFAACGFWYFIDPSVTDRARRAQLEYMEADSKHDG